MGRGGTDRRKLGLLCLLLHGFSAVAAAQTSDTSQEFWPEFDYYIGLNKTSRIYVLTSATRLEDLGAYADGQIGVHVDFWRGRPLFKRPVLQTLDQARSKMFMFRFGYIYSHPKNDSGTATESMVTGEVTGRAHLAWRLTLIDRNRFDFRWLDGDPGHRYRNRLKLERTFDARRFQLTPYIYAEGFYSLDDPSWTRLRYAAGAEWTITRHIVLEGYYLRQNTWGSVPQFVNALGLAAQFYFR